jgi:hypothetical protein
VQREGVVLAEGGMHQAAQLLLVLRGGDDQVWQLALGRDREHSLVAGAVLADQARPIDADNDRLVVLAHVVHCLVERALDEGRVQGQERAEAADREACGERHRVLFGDADVVHPIWEDGLELR